MERWLSGRKRRRAKALGMKVPRGFESHPLRTYRKGGLNNHIQEHQYN